MTVKQFLKKATEHQIDLDANGFHVGEASYDSYAIGVYKEESNDNWIAYTNDEKGRTYVIARGAESDVLDKLYQRLLARKRFS